MNGPGRQYRWRKHATSQWLKENETLVGLATDQRHAIVQQPGNTRQLVEFYDVDRQLIKRLKTNFGGAIASISARRLGHSLKAKAPKPIRIGERLVVNPRRAASRDDGLRGLAIPAGLAFGTGDHPTTAMCLRMIEQLSRASPTGWTFLDIGCGTGILSLAARCLGAGRVVAIDNDPDAISTAKANGRLNRIDGITFRRGDAGKQPGPAKFDLIAANVTSELIIHALPQWRTLLRPDGRLILSGILRSQERDIVRALQRSRLAPSIVRRRGKWIALLAARRQKVS